MNDARPLLLAYPSRQRKASCEGVGEGTACVSGRRVDDQSGRFVHHSEVRVLVHNPQRYLLGLGAQCRGMNNLDLNVVPEGHTV
jgi:hypothetical protein